MWGKYKMNENTIKQLKKISTPKTFSKDEYICYEGEPGNEMYIILKGTVGVYVSNTLGTLVEVAQLAVGEFFGEMAIFDKLPRSASCIALDDVICVSINQDNLIDFICQCPDIAEKILNRMSQRIRKLNNDLYKNTSHNNQKPVEQFRIPLEYDFSHVVKEPYQEAKYFSKDTHYCPVCSKRIEVTNIKKHLMTVRSIDSDGRTNYFMCDPLWSEITTCPHCHYSNYNINFFDINPNDVSKIKKVLDDEYPTAMETLSFAQTPFDTLVINYLLAIHINKLINGNDLALIGTLWLYLYWLSKDSGDSKFMEYCANNAIEVFKPAIDENQIDDSIQRCSIAMSLGNLLAYKKMYEQAQHYVKLATDCLDEPIRNRAKEFHKSLEKHVQGGEGK